MTLKNRVNWSISQGFDSKESGNDFLTSTNIVLPLVSNSSRGGPSHEACCSSDTDCFDSRLADSGGESFGVRQFSASLHRKREELRVSPADLSLPAGYQEQNVL